MRESIIVALEALLNADAGIKTVFRQFRQLDTISRQQYPCVMIEEDLPETGIARKTSGYADISFQVTLFIAVVDANAVSTALSALDVIVKKVVANNPTMSGTCMSAVIQPEVERIGTLYAPYGLLRRPVSFLYEGHASTGY